MPTADELNTEIKETRTTLKKLADTSEEQQQEIFRLRGIVSKQEKEIKQLIQQSLKDLRVIADLNAQVQALKKQIKKID